MNRKGFTLVELLATLAILAIIVVIGGVAISKTIDSAKQKNYDAIVANIEKAVELFYQECKYGRVNGENYDYCGSVADNVRHEVKISTLIEYGYIKPNEGNILVDPKNSEEKFCIVEYRYNYNENIHEYENYFEVYRITTNLKNASGC